MTHLACFIDPQGRVRRMTLPKPDSDYGVGHLVTDTGGKSYRISGLPHHEPQGGGGADTLWPAEPVTAADIPSLLTRKRG